jgi:hypothetical protein
MSMLLMNSSYKPVPSTNMTVPMRNMSAGERGNAQWQAITNDLNM